MKKHPFIVLLLVLVLMSCNNQVSNKIEASKITPNNAILEKKSKVEAVISTKHSNLFNVELVGVTKDSINTKRYYVDFSSACMCDSPSILLKENRAYLFGYCKDTLPPLSKEPYYTYHIIKITETDDSLSISLKNENNEKLELIFKTSNNELIYELKVVGAFPDAHLGSRVCQYFTYKATDFEIEDCGDFQG